MYEPDVIQICVLYKNQFSDIRYAQDVSDISQILCGYTLMKGDYKKVAQSDLTNAPRL